MMSSDFEYCDHCGQPCEWGVDKRGRRALLNIDPVQKITAATVGINYETVARSTRLGVDPITQRRIIPLAGIEPEKAKALDGLRDLHKKTCTRKGRKGN